MHIDESLAKGLASRCYKNIQKNWENNLCRFAASAGKYSKTKSSWKKFTSNVESRFPEIITQYYSGKYARKPYLGFTWIQTGEVDPIKDWEDTIFYFQSAILIPTEAHVEFSDNVCGYFGTHVARRIFQRIGVTESSLATPELILNHELYGVPLWSEFWRILINFSELKTDEIKLLSFPIPTRSGLLFSTPDDKRVIRINTYLHESQLSSEQKKLRESLMEIAKVTTPVFCYLLILDKLKFPLEILYCATGIFSYKLHQLYNETPIINFKPSTTQQQADILTFTLSKCLRNSFGFDEDLLKSMAQLSAQHGFEKVYQHFNAAVLRQRKL